MTLPHRCASGQGRDDRASGSLCSRSATATTGSGRTIIADTGGSSGALALEALDVLLSPAESRQVLPLLHPDLPVSERLDQLPAPGSDSPTDVVGWLQDLVADADGHWHSNWLRACAVHAAKGRSVLDQVDVDAARALGDPIIDEVLSSASTGNGRERTSRRDVGPDTC